MAGNTYNYKGEVDTYEALLELVGSPNDAYFVKFTDTGKALNALYIFNADTNSWVRETLYSRTIYDVDDYDDKLVSYNYKGEVDFFADLDRVSNPQTYDGYLVRYLKDSINNSITVINAMYYYGINGQWTRVPSSLKFQKNAILKKKINGFVYTLNVETNTDYVFTRELVNGTNRFKTLTEKLDEILTATSLQLDDTLTKSYFAADAKVTGDRIRALEATVSNSGSFSEFFTDYLNLFDPSAKYAGYSWNTSTNNPQAAASNKVFYVVIKNKKTNGNKISNLAILLPNITNTFKNKLLNVVGKGKDQNGDDSYYPYTFTPQEKTLDRIYALYNVNLTVSDSDTVILTFDFSSETDTDYNAYINKLIICDIDLVNKYGSYYKIKPFSGGKVMLDPLKVDSDIHEAVIMNKDDINITNNIANRVISISNVGDISLLNDIASTSATNNKILIGKKSADQLAALNYGIEFNKSGETAAFNLWINNAKFLALSNSNDGNINYIRGNDTLQVSTTSGSYLSFNNTNAGLRYIGSTFNETFRTLNITTDSSYTVEAGESVNIRSLASTVTVGNNTNTITISDDGINSTNNFNTKSLSLQNTDVYNIFAKISDLSNYVPLVGDSTITGNIVISGTLNATELTAGSATINNDINVTGSLISTNLINAINVNKNKVLLQRFENATEVARAEMTADELKYGVNAELNISKNSIIINKNNTDKLTLSPSNIYNENVNGVFNIDLASENIASYIRTKLGTLTFNVNGYGNTVVNISSDTGSAVLNVSTVNTNTIAPVTGNTTVNISDITTSTIHAANSGIIAMDNTRISALTVINDTTLNGNLGVAGNVTLESNSKVIINGTNIEIVGNSADGLVISDVVNGNKVSIFYKDGKLSGTTWEIDANGNATFATVTTYGGDSTLN